MPSVPQQPIKHRPSPALARIGAVRMGWAQLFLLALAVWAALLYSGIGSAIGVRPDATANRLETRAMAQLRHGGASQTARWGRSESSFEAGAKVASQPAISSPPDFHAPFAALLPLALQWLTQAEPQAKPASLTAGSSRSAPRWQTPLTRAPPPGAIAS